MTGWRRSGIYAQGRGSQPMKPFCRLRQHGWAWGLRWWLSGEESACNAEAAGDKSSIPGSGRSPGGGHGHPLQYSVLKNPMGRGAWWATVHGVPKSQTQLKLLSRHAWMALEGITHREISQIKRNTGWYHLYVGSNMRMTVPASVGHLWSPERKHSFLKNSFIYFNWRLIAFQYCGGVCHTSTWISPGCEPTPVPPPSPPTPLGCPRAPALSILLHALNSDWRSVSHTVM